MSTTARRVELGSFLRSRRERIAPEHVGLPAGTRRRTPGLRREEVAQLAGVGITWYTWLEQGRPINASAHVLGAVARTLRLDTAERDHLYRLAEVPQPVAAVDTTTPGPDDVDAILQALNPLPAIIVNARTDILRWNRTYGALNPDLVSAAPGDRNTLWALFMAIPEHSHILNRDEQAPEAVAAFRYRYSQHLNDPRWQDFVARLCAGSALFARLWHTHDVAAPRLCDKRYDFPGIGEVNLRSTGMDLTSHPENRLIIHTPIDENSRTHIEEILRRATISPTSLRPC
jgi:transcriptional regulator with XRE-family HTH domain